MQCGPDNHRFVILFGQSHVRDKVLTIIGAKGQLYTADKQVMPCSQHLVCTAVTVLEGLDGNLNRRHKR